MLPKPNPRTTPESVPPTTSSLKHFFTLQDWIAAATTFLISLATYVYYVCPNVTLEDSGELVTGAYNFGVPHPPGYPLWAFLGWVWSHVVTMGNPAYRIGLMSALTGASVVGILTLLMTRSTLMLLRSSPWTEQIEEATKRWMALTVGSSTALMFGFNRGVWLWACVPEMRVLNVFMFVATACTFFAWMMRSQHRGFLYVTILVYALGITNHQTIVVMALPFLVGALAIELFSAWEGNSAQNSGWMKALGAVWELLVAVCLCATAGFLLWGWLEASPEEVLSAKWSLRAVVAFAVGGGLLAAFGAAGWLNWRRALICTAVFLIGCSFYFYMPVASCTNPPMNWGYAGTKQGFLHAITRGQYEKMNFSMPWESDFWIQVWLLLRGILYQYSPSAKLTGTGVQWWLKLLWNGLNVLVVFGLALVTLVVPIWKWRQFRARARAWLVFLWAALLTTGFGLLSVINPQLDKTSQEINIKFFAPAHGFFAMLTGYGLVLVIAWVLARRRGLPEMTARVLCVGLLALPLIPIRSNFALCEQRNHDFGYQFGYRMFHPGGEYPSMETNAVLFGGSDPGRFVPTYMIFCESRVEAEHKYRDPNCDPEGGAKFNRSDVIIITQNALADSTYMSYIRDHYDYSRPDWRNPQTFAHRVAWQRALFGWAWHHLDRGTTYPKEPIWIPRDQDSQQAFNQYVQELRSRPGGLPPGIVLDGSRVSVQGVEHVMAINGILTQMIFEKNKDKHSFYTEESYPIPWMYPYLEPHGVIMKINKEPLPRPHENPARWQQLIARDRAYWDKLVADFLKRSEFRRDVDAPKAFSKLRSAIGGIYSYQGLSAEAEYAFQQARQLCPDSPEANFRLVQVYLGLNRYEDACNVLANLLTLDPLNKKVSQALTQVEMMKHQHENTLRLEAEYAKASRNGQLAIRLSQAYAQLGRVDRIQSLMENFLSQTNLTDAEILPVAQVYLQGVPQIPATSQLLRNLETLRTRSPKNIQQTMLLAQAYVRSGNAAKIQTLLDSYIAQDGLSADDLLNVAQFYININQHDRSLATVHLLLRRFPNDARAHYALAILQATRSAVNDALSALEQAIKLNPQLRAEAQRDARLNSIRSHPRFQQLVGASLALR